MKLTRALAIAVLAGCHPAPRPPAAELVGERWVSLGSGLFVVDSGRVLRGVGSSAGASPERREQAQAAARAALSATLHAFLARLPAPTASQPVSPTAIQPPGPPDAPPFSLETTRAVLEAAAPGAATVAGHALRGEREYALVELRLAELDKLVPGVPQEWVWSLGEAFDAQEPVRACGDRAAPDWVGQESHATKAGEDPRSFVGIGAAAGIRNPALRRATAETRARAEVARLLDGYLSSLNRWIMQSATPRELEPEGSWRAVPRIRRVTSIRRPYRDAAQALLGRVRIVAGDVDDECTARALAVVALDELLSAASQSELSPRERALINRFAVPAYDDWVARPTKAAP